MRGYLEERGLARKLCDTQQILNYPAIMSMDNAWDHMDIGHHMGISVNMGAYTVSMRACLQGSCGLVQDCLWSMVYRIQVRLSRRRLAKGG